MDQRNVMNRSWILACPLFMFACSEAEPRMLASDDASTGRVDAAPDAGTPPQADAGGLPDAGGSVDGSSGADAGPIPLTPWVSCDLRQVRCANPEPTCGPDAVASVVNGCWGPCVEASRCVPLPNCPVPLQTVVIEGTGYSYSNGDFAAGADDDGNLYFAAEVSAGQQLRINGQIVPGTTPSEIFAFSLDRATNVRWLQPIPGLLRTANPTQMLVDHDIVWFVGPDASPDLEIPTLGGGTLRPDPSQSGTAYLIGLDANTGLGRGIRMLPAFRPYAIASDPAIGGAVVIAANNAGPHPVESQCADIRGAPSSSALSRFELASTNVDCTLGRYLPDDWRIGGTSGIRGPTLTMTESGRTIVVGRSERPRLDGVEPIVYPGYVEPSPTQAVIALDDQLQAEWIRVLPGNVRIVEPGHGLIAVVARFDEPINLGFGPIVPHDVDLYVVILEEATGDLVQIRLVTGSGGEGAFVSAYDPWGQLAIAGAYDDVLFPPGLPGLPPTGPSSNAYVLAEQGGDYCIASAFDDPGDLQPFLVEFDELHGDLIMAGRTRNSPFVDFGGDRIDITRSEAVFFQRYSVRNLAAFRP